MNPSAHRVGGKSPVPCAVLVGLPGAGKTTIGRKLARRLEVPFDDTDALIEQHSGRTIAEIFRTDGEAGFRVLEEEVVAEALTRVEGVLALGGGAVLSAQTREQLALHRVIHLTLGVTEGVRRSQGSSRPLLAGATHAEVTNRYQKLMADRLPLYREVAWATVSTERRSSGKVVADIVNILETEARPPKSSERNR